MMKFSLLIIFGILITINSYFEAGSELSKYDLSKDGSRQVALPSNLNEISGLAVTRDGRVFAHGDERGIIYQIDPDDGEVLKRFFLGRWLAEEDFEGIAIAGEKFFIITSDGKIFEFREGKNEEAVDYKIYNSGASSKFDIEGLCYDPSTNALLIACKEYPGKNYSSFRTVYSYSLKDYKINTTPRFKIPIKKVKDKLGTKGFHPSGIERNPVSGSFFIIGSKDGEVIIELSKEGDILDMQRLDKQHHQPEGIAFLPDLSLLIADEKVKKSATLTKYKPQ